MGHDTAADDESLKRPLHNDQLAPTYPPQPALPADSAVTRAEKVEHRGVSDFDQPVVKRAKLNSSEAATAQRPAAERRKGFASIKAEFLVSTPGFRNVATAEPGDLVRTSDERGPRDDSGRGQLGRKKSSGQNTHRTFGSSRDTLQLCMSRARAPELSPATCTFGDSCRFEHDLRRYLRNGKRGDLDTFHGHCPVYDARGFCNAGWRCRFASAHSEEKVTPDGRKELILLQNSKDTQNVGNNDAGDNGTGIFNIVTAEDKTNLRKRRIKTPKADAYTEYLNKVISKDFEEPEKDANEPDSAATGAEKAQSGDAKHQNRALFVEAPFLPSEKRRIYYGAETPILAQLTTQGNLPFRRLCVELGAQVTWSEMAMGLPLIQGEKNEWALLKAHESELRPPTFTPSASVVEGYDNARDIRFGAQIAGNKPWLALKTTEILTTLCPNLRAIDLNCGCPIDLVYRQGAGSALLDSPGRLEKMLRGMNAVSGEIPITVKIRMGTKDNKPTADRLVKRLVCGGPEAYEFGNTAAGVAAITLHGRSRQQRYSRSADWSYISECAALINKYTRDEASQVDTADEVDPRYYAPQNKIYFIGNGDCYSHVDYYNHIQEAKVDSVMVARGALVKPWIFEEIEKGQYLDKSSTERLGYIEKFARYGLQAWGSDEVGVGTTRRFLLEWLSFAYRYVPLGLLEHLPPSLQDRPPAYRGRDDLETLLSSENYKDWIKISEMFLGPAHKDFHFEPKHRSNSYEIEAEG